MALAPGTRIGVYEVVGPLGAGGMGEVYRATDLHLKRAVALKVLPETLASDADRVARFQREAELLATLAHPAIAAIYGLEASTPTRALVLECVEGETLADRLARGPLPVAEALPLARQIADALDYAHEHGVLHRDLKPANLKVTPDGQVKVLDFGLARAIESGVGSREPGVEGADAGSPTVNQLQATVPAEAFPGLHELADSGGNPLYDIAPDGRRFVARQSDAQDATAGNRIHVILNWPALLRDRSR